MNRKTFFFPKYISSPIPAPVLLDSLGPGCSISPLILLLHLFFLPRGAREVDNHEAITDAGLALLNGDCPTRFPSHGAPSSPKLPDLSVASPLRKNNRVPGRNFFRILTPPRFFLRKTGVSTVVPCTGVSPGTGARVLNRGQWIKPGEWC